MGESCETVCVVLPCYRYPLLESERVSLERCHSVLGSYPMAIVKPESLDLTGLHEAFPRVLIESFPDEFFRGVGGYNRLLLSDGFYARFATYEFILIHQLDAFVFRDELRLWCDRDFDYVGAPWIRRPGVPGPIRLFLSGLRRSMHRRFNPKDRRRGGPHRAQCSYTVGNGGFSLRRVPRMRQVLSEISDRLTPYVQLDHPMYNEDVFFSIEANRDLQRVRLPSFQEGCGFAWEWFPEVAKAINLGRLPFGCHAWNKRHAEVWRPIFAGLGYDLDAVLAIDAAV